MEPTTSRRPCCVSLFAFVTPPWSMTRRAEFIKHSHLHRHGLHKPIQELFLHYPTQCASLLYWRWCQEGKPRLFISPLSPRVTMTSQRTLKLHTGHRGKWLLDLWSRRLTQAHTQTRPRVVWMHEEEEREWDTWNQVKGLDSWDSHLQTWWYRTHVSNLSLHACVCVWEGVRG